MITDSILTTPRAPRERLDEKDAPPSPIKVAVLVNLIHSQTAGGHVKCWERFAKAAMRRAECLDMTIHFMGDKETIVPLAPNVRYHLHP
ncbi:MAG: hypothetical protein V1899_09890, partial [Planctomycetota bacterium]